MVSNMEIIPFNKTTIIGNEIQYITDAISRNHLSGDGYYTKQCQAFFEQQYHLKKCLITTSCTHAMELAALLYHLSPGDEFIVPSFTFVSTANAFVLRGAKPIFADIRHDTLNIDETLIESLITKKTKLIVPVHYAGNACAMDVIYDIARKHRLEVFEDAAQGIHASYQGKYLGTMGSMGALSFHETKNIGCGEGGALFINDERYIEQADIIREKGTNRSQFLKGLVDKYTWVDKGSSYLPSDILSAFLYARLENIYILQSQREKAYNYYLHALQDLEKSERVQLPKTTQGAAHNGHIFYVLLKDMNTRDQLMYWLRERKITSVFHYIPLHSSPFGKTLGGDSFYLPVTDSISGRILRLPLFSSISEQEQLYIVEEIYKFFKQHSH